MKSQRGHQRRTPIGIRRINLCSSVNEHPDHFGSIQAGREVQRRPALTRADVGIGFVGEQHLYLLITLKRDGTMKH